MATNRVFQTIGIVGQPLPEDPVEARIAAGERAAQANARNAESRRIVISRLQQLREERAALRRGARYERALIARWAGHAH